MAKNNDKRAERMARSNRNVNRAITVLMAGVIAEFYLLMVNNYYVKGGVGQVLTMMTVLQVIDYIGCALFGAGLVVWLMRKKWTRFAPAAPWLLCIGFFFAVSSILMLKVYPQGTTMMCVIVPVVMLIGIVFLLYPREFSVQAVGLTASLMAMYLIHRGSGSDTWGGIVTGCSILAICVVAVLGVAVFKAGKNDGKLKKLGDLRIVSQDGDYKLIYAVLAVCALAIVAALAVSSIAYYGLWVLAIGTFLLAVYYTVSLRANRLIQELLLHLDEVGTALHSGAYPLYLMGRMAVGDWLAMAVVLAVTLLLCLLMYRVLDRTFLSIATASGGTVKAVYKEKVLKSSSAASALLRRELGRFTSSPNYMLNCGLSSVVLPALGVLLLVKHGTVLPLLEKVFGDEASGAVTALLCAALCLIGSMNDMSASSVSLEGKNLWLAQSLPVTPWQVLRAKLTMQLLLTAVPVAVCLVCAALAVPMTAAELAMLTAVSLLFTVFSALLGLFLGLRMPNLTWTREIIPIKQSASVAIALFGGWGYAAVLGGGYLLAGWHLGAVWYLGCFAAATLLACLALYLWLKKRGGAVLAAL